MQKVVEDTHRFNPSIPLVGGVISTLNFHARRKKDLSPAEEYPERFAWKEEEI